MKGIQLGTLFSNDPAVTSSQFIPNLPSEVLPFKQLGAMSNRHGLIAGATGTGKTVTLQVLAEGFSRLGVPVFSADIKGDLAGLSQVGSPHPKVAERVAKLALTEHSFKPTPVVFWDIFGKTGHPVRTTISEMGPLMLGYLLELNDTQEGVLMACFKIADDQGLLLLDLKDLRSLLTWVSQNSSELSEQYGYLAKQSIAAIQRDLLVLEQQGAEDFFGEPALDLADFMRQDLSGQGVVNLLDATKLVHQFPKLYACFLLWLLSELFESLPELGDPEVPVFVLFFDEAHLLFEDMPKPLIKKIEQVVRLVRSKGVGVYFVTQNPSDVPEDILGQLGCKIQHALRAFTPKDRRAVKAVADNFRQNPSIDITSAVTEVGVGEALVSVLDEDGAPTPVQRLLICPPESRIGPITDFEREQCLQRSPVKGRYDIAVDRESAYEILTKRAEVRASECAEEKNQLPRKAKRQRQGVVEAMLKSTVRAIGSQIGRRLVRGLMGSLLGRR